MKSKGFTLIELVMVIVIIGILVAIAIPRFISLRAEAQRARCQADVSAIRAVLSSWYVKYRVNNSCPSGTNADCDASGFPVKAQLQSKNSYFAENYFADKDLPDTTHIIGPTKDWSSYYTPSTGVMDMTTCCP